MNTTALYGVILAITQIVLTLVSYFLGYQTDKINDGRWFGFLPLLVLIAVLWLGIKAVRDEAGSKGLSYGGALGAGMKITLISAAIGALYTYVHFGFINPNYVDYLIEASRVKWAAANMSDAQMEAAEKGTRMFMKPVMMTVVGFIMGNVLGLIVSLIEAAFLKRPATDAVEATAAN